MLKKKRVPIVFEDDAVIVCEKPAGMPVQSDHTRDMDVLTILKHHIFEEQNSEEESYLAVVHRLDRPVGGLMVLAKTKEAAANLSEQIQNFEFEIIYEDSNIIILNKPVGIEVISENSKNSITRQLQEKYCSFKFPYPAHRLDRNTSGLMIFAKNLKTLEIFTASKISSYLDNLAIPILENNMKITKSTIAVTTVIDMEVKNEFEIE